MIQIDTKNNSSYQFVSLNAYTYMIFLMAMSTCCQYSVFIRTDHIILAICAEKTLLYNLSIRALLTVHVLMYQDALLMMIPKIFQD